MLHAAVASPELEVVLQLALDAVVVMRLDGTIVGWNGIAAQSFGWHWEEVAGRRMSELIVPPRYRDAHNAGLAHYHATGEGPVLDRRIEIEALHRAGHELLVELTITRSDMFAEPLFVGFLRDISERRDAQRRQDLLMRELNHRVKNMLAVVSGIAHQTARASPDIATFTAAFSGRIGSLAAAHDLLMQASWQDASLRALVEALLGSYAQGEGARITFGGPDVQLAPRQLLSVSMILHELLTNATKYGALAAATGHIDLSWHLAPDADGREEATLVWSETGGSAVVPPDHQGFGLRMMELSAHHDLHGRCERHWHDDGLTLRLVFPLAGEGATS